MCRNKFMQICVISYTTRIKRTSGGHEYFLEEFVFYQTNIWYVMMCAYKLYSEKTHHILFSR